MHFRVSFCSIQMGLYTVPFTGYLLNLLCNYFITSPDFVESYYNSLRDFSDTGI